MNQKEEIEKHQKKIDELKLKLDKAEHIFKTKYGYVTEKIEELTARRNELWAEQDKLLTMVAKVLSDNPEQFKHGYTNMLKKEIISRGDAVGEDQWRYTDRDAGQVVWDKYNHFQKESPEFQKIKKELDAIWKQEDNLKAITKGYSDACEQIKELNDEIKWEKQFIEQLKNIGWFRQYSKEQKERDIKNARQSEMDKEMDKFRAWFDENYLPKMKKAIASKKGGEN
jgi:hypothetical protein